MANKIKKYQTGGGTSRIKTAAERLAETKANNIKHAEDMRNALEKTKQSH